MREREWNTTNVQIGIFRDRPTLWQYLLAGHGHSAIDQQFGEALLILIIGNIAETANQRVVIIIRHRKIINKK